MGALDEILDEVELVEPMFDGVVRHLENEIIEQEQKNKVELVDDDELVHFLDFDNILYIDVVSVDAIDITIDECELFHVFDDAQCALHEVELDDRLLLVEVDGYYGLSVLILDDDYVEDAHEKQTLDEEALDDIKPFDEHEVLEL